MFSTEWDFNMECVPGHSIWWQDLQKELVQAEKAVEAEKKEEKKENEELRRSSRPKKIPERLKEYLLYGLKK